MVIIMAIVHWCTATQCGVFTDCGGIIQSINIGRSTSDGFTLKLDHSVLV